MKRLLTLTVLKKINVSDEDEFEQERDDLIERLETMGLAVSIDEEAEEDDLSDDEDGADDETELVDGDEL
jgi:hypothetical protein